MSGGLHDVKNAIWMRTVAIGLGLIVLGMVAYGAFAVGLASVKHHEWEDAEEHHEAAHEAEIAAASFQSTNLTIWIDAGSPADGVIYDAMVSANETLHTAEEAAHDAEHEEEQAHLSYLTWTTAGKTIMVMFLIYGSLFIVSGFFNSIQPEPEHHGHDDDHEEHHGSASPILMASGILLIMMGFPGFVTTAKSMLGIDVDPGLGEFTLFIIGAIILMAGIGNWWREDLVGFEEQISTGQPFGGQDIRKAGMWIFLISEMMVFASFFSSYLRMRTEWCTQWAVDAGRCDVVDTVTASDLLRHDVMTLLPGAVNTFALIISSYTIVLALKTAKNTDWEPSKNKLVSKMFPSRQKAVRNYLIITLALGSLFIVLKLVEWSHLIAEGFDIGTQAGSIFYVATGAHGIHVFVGLLVMLFMVFKADTVGYDEKNGQGIEYFGLYWHFVDLAWVAIFPAFYLY